MNSAFSIPCFTTATISPPPPVYPESFTIPTEAESISSMQEKKVKPLYGA